jgi:Uri superfamily endonuclease
MTSLPDLHGTYIFFGRLNAAIEITVGRFGTVNLPGGDYAYAGSAFGPGGIAARVGHHLSVSRRPRWHLDFLRPHLVPRAVWFATEKHPWEHEWAAALQRIRGASVPCRGFGSSDCKCLSHLVHFRRMPTVETFRRHLHLGSRPYIKALRCHENAG